MGLFYGNCVGLYRHEGTEPDSVPDNLIVTLSSFTGKFVTIHVTKQPGMENVDLLSSDTSTAQDDGQEEYEEEETTDDDGYWESLTGYAFFWAMPSSLMLHV